VNNIEQSEGYLKLKKAIEDDGGSGWNVESRLTKLEWAVNRAKHYEARTGISASEILTKWETDREYWYMNYYQDANQPTLDGDFVKVFDDIEAFKESVGDDGFRCPNCKGVSSNPYNCNSGIVLTLLNSKKGKKDVCNWSAGGLFKTLGKGTFIFLKNVMVGLEIFKPVRWESGAEA